MLTWIAENGGTILVALVLAGILSGIVIRLVKNRKKGTCSCGCEHCTMSGSCHK